MAVACSLLATSARAAAPPALTAADVYSQLARDDGPAPVAQREARGDDLAKKSRGQLEMLPGAETAAEAAAGRVRVLDRQLAAAHQQLARLAAASYMAAPPTRRPRSPPVATPRQPPARPRPVNTPPSHPAPRDHHCNRRGLAGGKARQPRQ